MIVNPQADRSQPQEMRQKNQFLTAGIVDEDAGGITVRGAKMLATAGIMANEVFVSSLPPLGKGDENYALSFVVPMNAPGLRVLSRKSYEAAAVSAFDNPLSSRLDENDALLYFDDVRVPWDRIFVCRDIRNVSAAVSRQVLAHVFQNYQAQIRLFMVKGAVPRRTGASDG